MQQWKRNNADLPLIACFSDSFPHKPTKQTKFALDSINKAKVPRNFGYYQWAEDTACTSIWETRLFNQLALVIPMQVQKLKIQTLINIIEKDVPPHQLQSHPDYLMWKEKFDEIQQKAHPYFEEIEYVRRRLNKFSESLPKLHDEGYDVDYFTIIKNNTGQELGIVFKNEKTKSFSELPAGYRRLYSIVFELAYRAYILNGDKEPNGIVLIDEIDLHLHPSLEQKVVQCFREVFPNVQFIMTTHSASVISNLDTTEFYRDEVTAIASEANQILFMQDNNPQPEVLPVIYGLDTNATLRDFMGTPSRNEEMRKKGDEYLTYCSLDLKKEAETVLNDLINDLGAEHAFIMELKEKAKEYEVH